MISTLLSNMPPAREKSVAYDATADHGEIMHQSTLNKP